MKKISLEALAEVQVFNKDGDLIALGEQLLGPRSFSGLTFSNVTPCIYAPKIHKSGKLYETLSFDISVKIEKSMLVEINEIKLEIKYQIR